MKRQTSKPILLLMLIAMLSMIVGGSASAFTDISNQSGQDSILRLKDKGIVSGDKQDRFNPDSTINTAIAVALIVKGLDLNIDHMRFIKEPLPSDYFTQVKDRVWYSQYFVIAQFSGLGLSVDVDPAAEVTREQFAQWLFGALSAKGDYAWIEIYMMLADEDQVSAGYMESIQKLLIAKIATLDKDQNFRPTDKITKAEAAVMVDKTIEFIATTEQTPVEPEPEKPAIDAQLTSTAVNADVNLVTVTAQLPHPGYSLTITSIEFNQKEAIINYALTKPDPERMYPQVITEAKVNTFISSDYVPVLGEYQLQVFAQQPTIEWKIEQ